MYLKQLEIYGFKSFAEKTTLSFLPAKHGKNSITTIVGPNGSGKSNVSDAIRWVLGEQSMKQLRGKKSHDIIFSGSLSKGQMSVASVMMTLDNSDGRVDLDYSEIVIGRKLYRSGESEYFMNGHVVRLFDLQLLLAKAQFGQGSYAVIGQGMIDRMLLQSPQDRKDFFDEATGIKEFQIKRHQATLKLARTEEHVAQAELLLNEISPRLKTLSRQVKKLEKRQELTIQLQEKQETYYATLWQYHADNIVLLQESIQAIDKELRQAQEHLVITQEELSTLAQASSRQEAFIVLQSAYQEIVNKKNILERERAVLQGKLQTEYSKSGQHQVGWLDAKINSLRAQKEQLDGEVQLAEQEYIKKEKLFQKMGQQQEMYSIERTQLRTEIAALDMQLQRVKSEQSVFQITGLRAVQAVLESQHRLGDVRGVVAQLGDVEEQYQIALDVAAGSQLSSIVVGSTDDARSCVEFLRQGRFGVATFLPLSKIKERHIPPFVYDFLDHPRVHGLAQELIRFDNTYAPVFSFVFGSTLVVDDFATAREIGIGKVRMVTLEGDLFETSGAVKGGHRRRQQHGLSFADGGAPQAIAAKTEELEKTIAEKRQGYDQLEITIERLQTDMRMSESAVQVAKNKQEMLEKQLVTVEGELSTLEQELALETMSPEDYGDVMKELALQKESVDIRIDEIIEALKGQEEKMEAFNAKEEEKKQRVFTLQDNMQEVQVRLNNFVAQKNEKQVSLAKFETKQEDLLHELYQELHSSIEPIIERGVPTVELEDIDQVQVDVQKFKYQLSLIGGIDDEVIDEYRETQERHEALHMQLEDLGKALRDLEKLVDELDKIMKKKRSASFAQIKKEFSRYFDVLFAGGKAELIEVYGYDDPSADAQDELDEELEEGSEYQKKKRQRKVLTGIDITACPPGKKIKHIQTLSGGERTMTSIALMCAILKTNPSPFVVLDEVEAALDEANTVRVVDIIKELSLESQFIIITHNRVTMHAADALYGVTMGNDGMSHLLSVKLGDVPENALE
ncbi:AAA family ATPase [Patescibacteria group bacterium]|nr:AAA family ATPase [Patescibacteria group bacterium]MBU1721907.1 AAA family ATPase [Patescibacteria group bacterium]MBU1900861.1 AAA family ATPase [Patescibacteria group bacterium]